MHDVRPELINWALAHGIPEDALEKHHGRLSWVLKPESRKLNLFDPSWWDLIAGKEHRWARALNSSQCFAVNLVAGGRSAPKIIVIDDGEIVVDQGETMDHLDCATCGQCGIGLSGAGGLRR